MNPVQYLILNKTLTMSVGKAAAQAAHASQMGLLLNTASKSVRDNPYDSSIVNRWMAGGHYAKVVLEADDLMVAEKYLMARGFEPALIIDEGRTEVAQFTPTALGLPVLDKDNIHVRETFSTFKLYNDKTPAKPKRRWSDKFKR
jgi:PTH2 family peptidyl-tRNA hydrolase